MNVLCRPGAKRPVTVCEHMQNCKISRAGNDPCSFLPRFPLTRAPPAHSPSTPLSVGPTRAFLHSAHSVHSAHSARGLSIPLALSICSYLVDPVASPLGGSRWLESLASHPTFPPSPPHPPIPPIRSYGRPLKTGQQVENLRAYSLTSLASSTSALAKTQASFIKSQFTSVDTSGGSVGRG